jgi:hypothetical protein
MTSVGDKGGTGAEEEDGERALSIVDSGDVKPDVEGDSGERISEERVGERVTRSEDRL